MQGVATGCSTGEHVSHRPINRSFNRLKSDRHFSNTIKGFDQHRQHTRVLLAFNQDKLQAKQCPHLQSSAAPAQTPKPSMSMVKIVSIMFGTAVLMGKRHSDSA